MLLPELAVPTRRLAFVGLAKNTGKTETLTHAVQELRQAGRRIGVTSVGRDGEKRDVIDVRIEKPPIELPAWSLVASTEPLLRKSAIAYQRLAQTGIRTPLGRVVVARLLTAGAVEIAGPSSAADVRAVCETMIKHGADHVLIDGAVDRRAASSPAVSDSLVMSTGAVLDADIERVVGRTRDAVRLVRLPMLEDPRMRALAVAQATTVLASADLDEEPLALPPRFMLHSSRGDIAALLDSYPTATHLLVWGALCEAFLEALVYAANGRELQLVVADSTKVFLSRRGCDWFERQGISIRVLRPIRLLALTVNPVAPHSHDFDSRDLRTLLAEAIPGLPILDVREHTHELAGAA